MDGWFSQCVWKKIYIAKYAELVSFFKFFVDHLILLSYMILQDVSYMEWKNMFLHMESACLFPLFSVPTMIRTSRNYFADWKFSSVLKFGKPYKQPWKIHF